MNFVRKLLESRKFICTVSTLAIVVCAAIMIFNIVNQQRVTDRSTIESFQNTVTTMHTILENYLTSEQEKCDMWAQYLNRNNPTVGQAMDYLDNSIINPYISAQLISLDTYRGMSTVVRADDPDSTDYQFVSYSDRYSYYADIAKSIDKMAYEDNTFNVTSFYYNPVNNQKVISFVRRVQLTGNDGELHDYALLRVMPSSLFEKLWIFPTIYENTNVELIDLSGQYVSDVKLEGQSNFFEYICCANNLSSEDINTFKKQVVSGVPGYAFYKTDDGENTLFAYEGVNAECGDWIMIAYIPKSSMASAPFPYVPVITMLITFIALFFINTGYFRLCNYRLKKSAAELSRANAAKTEFLATMSHDIRTPMNAIIGMTAIAEKEIGNSEHVKECLAKIKLSCNHLLTLINDILDISKIESGKYTINPIAFPLSDLTDNVFNVVRQNISEKNITLEIHTHGEMQEYVYADQLRLNQIYINILTNAVKYTNSGGKITVDLYQEESSTVQDGVKLVYRVADTGIGMSEEFMGKMFEAFSRAKDGRVNEIQGTGLGLAITKQLVDLMNGTIDVESTEGKGSVFTVTLDLPLAENRGTEIRLTGASVLIIDDDYSFLESAGAALKSAGVNVSTAAGCEEGIKMIECKYLENNNYDAIIVDWNIQGENNAGMKGSELISKIRDRISFHIPILVVTEYDLSEIEDEGTKAGADGFLNKPVFRSTLCRALSHIMEIDNAQEQKDESHFDISGMNILVAEDNDVNYEIAETLLEYEGAHCSRAENGRVCVDMLESGEEKYDLVLMDVQMPVLKGIDAARIIRTSDNEQVRNIPVIAMTADAFAENVNECLEAGMDDHIAKPIDMTVVLEKIKVVMQNHKNAS
jgi:signal transduction histidine kinase/DNA-binding response OmpR family regulator